VVNDRLAHPGRGFSCGPASTTTWNVNNDEAYLNFVISTCLNPQSTVGTYTVALGQDLDLSASTAILNNNRAGIALVIEGNNFIVSGQNISGTRPFNIAADTHVTLQNITITEGNAGTEWGGGILNNGTLTLTNSTLSNNLAGYGGSGIVNYSAGTLTVIDSTISNNANSGFGGGIYNYLGAVTLSNTQLINNSALYVGGGIINNGTLTLTNSTLSGNSAFSSGGINNSGTLTMINSTLSGSSADQGGGISNISGGVLTLINSTLSGGHQRRCLQCWHTHHDQQHPQRQCRN
jgi:hypothetical protein